MKKSLSLTALFIILVSASHGQSFWPEIDTAEFVFTIRVPNLKAIDCYPQEVTTIAKEEDNYRINLITRNPYANSDRFEQMKVALYDVGRVYDGEVARYLQPTPLIRSESESVRRIADTLFGGETITLDIISKALRFTNKYLSPDDSVARQIDAGTCRTIDSDSVIERKRGTCSEYTNLFAALMRYKNIPTRFSVGYFYMPEGNAEATHAWPECYIDGVGWCAFDPTMDMMGYPVFVYFAAIRLRYGLDYEDCGIETLAYDIEPIEIEKVR